MPFTFSKMALSGTDLIHGDGALGHTPEVAPSISMSTSESSTLISFPFLLLYASRNPLHHLGPHDFSTHTDYVAQLSELRWRVPT